MLEVNGLTVCYGAVQAVQAVDAVDLAVAAGEIVALMGPNGAGKSSILNTVAGLVRPTTGAVRLRGQDVTRRLAADRVGAGMALVIEGRGVFSDMTVRENRELGAYVRALRGRERDAAIDGIVDLFPRLGERIGQDAATLSGGEQQMLVIGRALMSRPTLLLLDEPSLGLAPKVVDEIASALRRLVAEQGIGVLVSEQNAALGLDLADRGYVMHNGHVQVEGQCVELRGGPDLMALYMGAADGSSGERACSGVDARSDHGENPSARVRSG